MSWVETGRRQSICQLQSYHASMTPGQDAESAKDHSDIKDPTESIERDQIKVIIVLAQETK